MYQYLVGIAAEQAPIQPLCCRLVRISHQELQLTSQSSPDPNLGPSFWAWPNVHFTPAESHEQCHIQLWNSAQALLKSMRDHRDIDASEETNLAGSVSDNEELRELIDTSDADISVDDVFTPKIAVSVDPQFNLKEKVSDLDSTGPKVKPKTRCFGFDLGAPEVQLKTSDIRLHLHEADKRQIALWQVKIIFPVI
ncbi:hypothetical protein B0H14DRAFT_2606975 [Mycena olivaceomarginata]|nr:hypothetical protein B0H14DRAFT_2606975 [Mycena olivaceomarginata]